MIDLNKYKIIDLSDEIRPAMYQVDGGFLRGKVSPHVGQRNFKARQFISRATDTFMWDVEAETHLGTHAECPAHVRTEEGKEGGVSAGEIPVEQWFGEAIVIDIMTKKKPIVPDDLKRIKEKDIVILRSSFHRPDRPYLTVDGAESLIKKKVKQLCIDEVNIQVPAGEVHDTLIQNNVILTEGLVNLHRITKERVIYIGLGLKWMGLDSAWVRAIALEEK